MLKKILCLVRLRAFSTHLFRTAKEQVLCPLKKDDLYPDGISVEAFIKLRHQQPRPNIIDLRTDDERENHGLLEKAVHLPCRPALFPYFLDRYLFWHLTLPDAAFTQRLGRSKPNNCDIIVLFSQNGFLSRSAQSNLSYCGFSKWVNSLKSNAILAVFIFTVEQMKWRGFEDF